jgi:uncharacterized membrane protein
LAYQQFLQLLAMMIAFIATVLALMMDALSITTVGSHAAITVGMC